VQPWGRAKAGLGLPQNAATGRPYSGVNILILWGAVIEKGFASQHWLTFRQSLDLGGNVRKGEHGTTVCYADRFIPKAEIERAAKDGDEAQAVPFLKRFTLFNVAQCDGLPERLQSEPEPMPERATIPHAEALIAATGADFRIGGNRAFYVPSADYIQVPPQPSFYNQIDYYRTCFHELGHHSGHKSRLNRDLTGAFGSSAYSREELVAEMTSAFICATLGIVPTVRHVRSYPLALAIGDRVRLFKRTNAKFTETRTTGNIGRNGTVLEIAGIAEDGLILRSPAGKEGFVAWSTLRHERSSKAQLAYGCQTAHKRDPGSASKKDPFDYGGWGLSR